MTTAEILMSKFGAKGCISRAKAICEQKYGEMLRFERVHGEYLKSHCDPKYAAYRDGDATVRSGICLGEFKYAEDAIVAAALTMYIEAMKKLDKKEAKKGKTDNELCRIALDVYEVCRDAIMDWQCESQFDFNTYKAQVAGWLDENWEEDKRHTYIKEALGLDNWYGASRDWKFLPRSTRDTVELLRRKGVKRIEDWEKMSELVHLFLQKMKPHIISEEERTDKACKSMLKTFNENRRRTQTT